MAHRYLGSNFCSLLTFGVKGGYEGGRKCFNAFRLFKRMVNMGDAKSLSCHPASTTHRQLTPEEQAKVGVTPEMIRLSVGIEHIDDILEDLGQALEKAQAEVRTGKYRFGRHDMPLIIEGGRVPTRWAEKSTVERLKVNGKSRSCVNIALINNMPDAALEDTELQFFELWILRRATFPSSSSFIR